jgi:hypothetical protein
MKKTLIAAMIASMSLVPVAGANAQEAPAASAAVEPTVGATVFGKDGGEIGKIESAAGGNFVVAIDDQRATLPAASLYKGDKGLTIAMSKADLMTALNAASAQQAAAKDAAIMAGASVMSQDNVPVATIEKVEGDNVTLALADGGSVALAKKFFTVGDAGMLKLIMTATDFKAAVASATASAGTAQASADATADTDAEAAAADEEPTVE